MQRVWRVRKYNAEQRKRIEQFSSELRIKPLIAALLIARGIDEEEKAHKFLYPSEADLHSPFLLKDMDKAVRRILEAINRKEKILIWGDYDVDGTTGTALLRKTFRKLGIEADFYIPHRIRDGYGIQLERLKTAKQEGYSLIISVDTGSTAQEAGLWAKENGIDLIVTDHHVLKNESYSPFFALVNPHQIECSYPNKRLAGVGVAFKLAHALMMQSGISSFEGFLREILELTALGTIADIMELAEENRSIVALGLRELNSTNQAGLKALMEIAGCTDELDSYAIGFRIAPRINAAGRLQDASCVIELLETENLERAKSIASSLDQVNKERQKLQEQAVKEAIEMARQKVEQKNRILVVASSNWHRGIVGLVAARLVERFCRPSLAISIEDGMAHGSARSIGEYNITVGLEACSEILAKYGGHAKAAGFTLGATDIQTLDELINAHAADKILDEHMTPKLDVEAWVRFSSIDFELCQQIKRLEPFGLGNPRPIIATKCVRFASQPSVLKEKHLKGRLKDETGGEFEAVWWNGVNELIERGVSLEKLYQSTFDVAYEIETRVWRDLVKIQLSIKDIRL